MSITCKKVSLLFGYTMNNSTLEHVKNYPYLGVSLADNLLWSDYIHKVSCKANCTLDLLQRNLWNCKWTTKEIAYMSIVRPQFEYASSV